MTALRRLAQWAVLTALATVSLASVAETAWVPTRPVTLVVPYNAGGGTDATARAVAKRLSALWKQPVIVENLGGADGLLGTRKVIDSPPDGYTLLFQVPSLVLMKYQPSLRGIDPVQRLEPISMVATSPTALVITGALPIQSLDELISYCKKHPCSAGSGENSSKIRARQFADDFKLPNFAVVSYRGTAPIVNDLVSGNLTMAFTGITAALQLHKTGRVKILVTNGDRRPGVLPEVPTSTEAGWKDSYSVTWYGVLAPKGTQMSVLNAIANTLKSAAADPEVKLAIATAGAEPSMSSPSEFATQIRKDDARLSALAKRFPFD